MRKTDANKISLTDLRNDIVEILSKYNLPEDQAGQLQSLKKQADVSIAVILDHLSRASTQGEFAGTNGLYWLMLALQNAAFQKDTASVKEITTLFNKCNQDEFKQLPEALCQTIKQGIDAGASGLYWLMSALQNAAFQKDAASVKEISTCITTLFDKCGTDGLNQLFKGLCETTMQGELAGTNGLYWLMLALREAAFEKDAASVKEISTCITTLFKQCGTDGLKQQLLEGLCEKRTRAGANGLYWLMLALREAAFQKDTANVKDISTCITTLFDKCDQDGRNQLFKGLCETRMQGNLEGSNGLYWLMSALREAAIKKDTASVKEISTCITTLFDKCGTDGLKQQLLEGLCDTITQGELAGTSGLYWLMSALKNATLNEDADCVDKISTLATTLFKQCNKDGLNQLLKSLCETRTQGDWAGTNDFYWLMLALRKAAYKNDTASVDKISTLATTLFKQCDKDGLKQQLLEGLCKTRTQGKLAGTSGLYLLMSALCEAAFQKGAASVKEITALITTLFNNCNQDEFKKLLAGLCQTAEQGSRAGTNGLYYLMAALREAAFKKDTTSVKEISTCITTLFKQCDQDGLNQLLTGLCETRTQGKLAGASGLYWLMSALRNAALDAVTTNVETITGLITTLFEKCDTDTLVERLFTGLSHARTQGPTGFSMLLQALENTSDDVRSKITDSMVALVITLDKKGRKDTKIMDQLLSYKEVLRDSIIKRIDTIDNLKELKDITAKDTVLGQMIDHNTSGFHRLFNTETNTRKIVDQKINEKDLEKTKNKKNRRR